MRDQVLNSAQDGFSLKLQEDLTVTVSPPRTIIALSLFTKGKEKQHTWKTVFFLKRTSQKSLFSPEFSLFFLLSILISSRNITQKKDQMMLVLELGEKDYSVTTYLTLLRPRGCKVFLAGREKGANVYCVIRMCQLLCINMNHLHHNLEPREGSVIELSKT